MTELLRSDWLWAVISASVFALVVAGFVYDGLAKRRKIRQVWKDWHRRK